MIAIVAFHYSQPYWQLNINFRPNNNIKDKDLYLQNILYGNTLLKVSTDCYFYK